MSDSNRQHGYSFDLTMLVGAALTVIALCVFLFFLGVKYGADSERPKQQTAGSASKADEDAKLACFNSVATFDKINCLEKQIKAEHESQRADYDLIAQQQMADWALLIVIISGVQAILSLGGVYLLVRNLNLASEATNAAVEANNVAREIGEAQVRAYLVCTSARFSMNERGVWCYVDVTNTGQSPAISSFVRLRLFIKRATDTKTPTSSDPNVTVVDYVSADYPVIAAEKTESMAIVWPPELFEPDTLRGLKTGDLTFVARGTSECVDVFNKKQSLKVAVFPHTDKDKIQRYTGTNGVPWAKGELLLVTIGPIRED